MRFEAIPNGARATTRRNRNRCGSPRKSCTSSAAIRAWGTGPSPPWAKRRRGQMGNLVKTRDGNEGLYGMEGSGDYDPGPALEKIQAPLLAVNSADDLINPPELEILEREIKRVPHGRAVTIPFGPDTRGHGSH